MIKDERLSIKKSIKLLKEMLVWGVMALWIFFLTILLSSSANAQPTQLDWDKPVKIENREYSLVDIDAIGHATVKYKEYNSEGQLIVVGTYYNQKPDGVWLMYDGYGNLISKAIYVGGVLKQHKFKVEDRNMTILYKRKRREYICSF